MNKIRKITAFTLMETLITVVILGIIAVIVVPNLINRQVENANRTKVKKAMAAYEKAINFIILENDIKSTEELKEFGEEENCKFSKAYFKTVQDGANDCIFKTADRVWWNITDITNPIIILKDSQLNKSTTELQTLAKNVTDKTVFAMVGRFDDLGTLRVNDNAYEQTYGTKDQRKYVAKLWYFITMSDSVLNEFDRCTVRKQETCTINVNGVNVTYNKISSNRDIVMDKLHNGTQLCSYDRETQTSICGYAANAVSGDYWITGNLGTITASEAKSSATCSSSIYSACLTIGDYYEAARQKCENSGGRLANLAELRIAYENGVLPYGRIWATEDSATNNAYMLNSNGNVHTGAKSFATSQVMCIGE